MIKNHADASTDNPLNSRHPLDTKPSGDTAALMAPMASQSDAEAAQMRECVRAAEDTVKASGTCGREMRCCSIVEIFSGGR